jgi:hypothetical protein
MVPGIAHFHEHKEDLAGLKVGHDLNALQEGEDRILTLKDSRILDNEGSFHSAQSGLAADP